MLAAVLILQLACPPTAIPKRGHADQAGHFLPSPYGIPDEIESPPVAALSIPTSDLWVGWALRTTPLLDVLSSSDLEPAQLAWWRAHTSDPSLSLRTALDRSNSARTRALLTTTLALVEYAKSCPIAPDVDGACRAPDTDLLLRRHAIPLERARQWTKLARSRWAEVDVDPDDVDTWALLAEFELAVATTDYESLLDATIPDDLWFVVEDWRQDSGVEAWEKEYARQVKQVEESRARIGAWFESTMGCAHTQLQEYERLLWIDAHSSGVMFLRSARIMIAFSDALDAEADRQSERLFGSTGQRWVYRQARPADPIRAQAHAYLGRCLEISQATLDLALEQACSATLGEAPPLVEFVASPHASTILVAQGVVGPDAIESAI